METAPKKYERFRYSQETLEKALKAISDGVITLNKASKAFNIPKSTLSNKLSNKVPWQRKMGPSTELTFDEEKKLAEWILAKAKLGFPMHPEEVYDTVEIFLKENNRESKFIDGRPGKKWLSLFLKRHPNVTKRNSEIISKARAAVTEKAIRNWFAELDKFLEEERAMDIKNDPTRIFNTDETGVMTCPKTGLILGPKNYKNTYEIASGKEKESITVLCTFSADGNNVPPFVIYPYKRMPPAVVQNFPDSWFIGRSESGWMVSTAFFSFIKMFYEWLQQNKIKLPVLLFLDGHKSHINQQMFDFCREKGIMLFCLYPNSTHILQPCDVGIFGPLKKSWKKVVRKYKQTTTAPITKQNFAPKFKEAYDDAIKTSTIKKSFKACGLCPINPDAVDYSRCISNRRQEIADQRGLDTTIADIEAHKNDLRSTIKVIETEVGQIIRNEFVLAYNTTRSHSHQYFTLWAKCKAELENKKKDHPTTTESPEAPIDLSASSVETTNAKESDSMVIEISSQTCSEILDNSILFGKSLEPLEFNTTDDIMEFIIENEISLPAVIPLPWYETPENVIEINPFIDPQNVCSSVENQSLPMPAIRSTSPATENNVLPEFIIIDQDIETLSPMPAIPSTSTATENNVLTEFIIDQPIETILADPTECSTLSKKSQCSSLDHFLKYPELPQKKTQVKKNKETAPFGLTGLKYKEYMKALEDKKKKKEEEIENRKKKREEKKLIQKKKKEKIEKKKLKRKEEILEQEKKKKEIENAKKNEKKITRKRESENKNEEEVKRPKKDTEGQIKITKLNDTEKAIDNSNKNRPIDIQVNKTKGTEHITTDQFVNSNENEHTDRQVKKKLPNNMEIAESTLSTITANLFGKYVITQFKTGKRIRYFVGKVLMVNDEDKKCKIDFLRKKSVTENVVNFMRPQIPDIAEIDFVDIQRVLSEPIYSRRGLISFTDLKFKDIE